MGGLCAFLKYSLYIMTAMPSKLKLLTAELDAVLLSRRWLEKNHKTGVQQVDTCDRKKHQDLSQGIGARQIATFLSKDGKTLSKSNIATFSIKQRIGGNQ